jgi:rSAM/selenodomain-associated transferase 2/rSAM/selenodomain-associated transferase 1
MDLIDCRSLTEAPDALESRASYVMIRLDAISRAFFTSFRGRAQDKEALPMRHGATVAVIIPVLDEEAAIGKVIASIPEWVDDVIVVDNGSHDRTAAVARTSGARVFFEPTKGYGAACLQGTAQLNDPDVVAFLDGDFSDYPEEMHLLVDPVAEDRADLVIGSRILGQRERGSVTLQARLGNKLACGLIARFWDVRYTDLGPFRAINYGCLRDLEMQDRNYGWTVEMQIKAVQRRFRVQEIPVSYRRRIGRSKVSGTFKGAVLAGAKILATIFRSAIQEKRKGKLREPRERVVLFTRYPEPGKTKTRMIPFLGAEKAADLHAQMTEFTVDRLKEVKSTRAVSIEIRFAGGTERLMRRWLGKSFVYANQGSDDLGMRMLRSCADAFREGVKRVVVVGTDCPGWGATTMNKAFRLLLRKDVVLGPAQDGGYYLVGLSRLVPEIFSEIPWGTDRVMQATTEIIRARGISVAFVDPFQDVDRPEDLPVWEETVRARYGCSLARYERDYAIRRSSPLFEDRGLGTAFETPLAPISKSYGEPGRVSVIIPTLNEEASIGSALLRVVGMPDIEVIVADGGSTDRTAELARCMGARVITSPAGRAQQMNAGARQATGETLVFLHADTLLPEGWPEAVRDILNWPGTALGAFAFRLDHTSASTKIIEKLANVRAKLMQMPYGDQVLFLRTGLFHRVGGFLDLPVMEDFEFVRRVRRLGKVQIAPLPAVTSSRRWRRLGVWRLTIIHQVILLAYLAGSSPRMISWLTRRRDAEPRA